MARSTPRYPDLLFGAGVLASVGLASQLFSVFRDHDASSALGRLSLVGVALPYAPLLVMAIVLLLGGSWNTDSRDRRLGLSIGLGLLALAALALLPLLVQDAGTHAFGVAPGQLSRYRLQFVRVLLYLGVGSLLLLWTVWRYRRPPAPTT